MLTDNRLIDEELNHIQGRCEAALQTILHVRKADAVNPTELRQLYALLSNAQEAIDRITG